MNLRNLCGHIMATFLVATALTGCGSRSEPAQPEQATSETQAKTMVVTSLVLKEFAETVADSAIQISLLTPADTPARLWRPKVADIRRLQSADRILLQGAGYEPWKDRITVAQSRIVESSARYPDQLIEIPDFVTHQHGPEGAHSHPGIVWSTWLDPELLASQLQQVTAACIELRPDQKAEFETRSARLSLEIDALDRQLESLKAALSSSTASTSGQQQLLSDEPYALYLGRRIGLKITYLNWPEPPEPLSDEQKQKLSELVSRSAGPQTKVILIRNDRRAEDVEFAKSVGLRVVTIDLCEKMSDTSGSLIVRMKQNLDRLQDALQN